MINFLSHVYNHAETYTVLFAWATIPMAFYASYLFLQHHYGMFTVPENGASSHPVKGHDHGAN